MRPVLAAAAVLVGLVTPASVDAGQTVEPSAALAANPAVRAGGLPAGYEGPPVPELPETFSRDETGRVTVRAVRLDSPLRLDGRLDEAIYETLGPMRDFIQMEPREGAPATEKTEVWILFDKDNIYVSARCWESQPERMIMTEMRRDNNGVFQNENFSFMLDTFYDRRNGVVFMLNPLGGRMDAQITNQGQWNGDWNPVWEYGIARFSGGWSLEAAIPFDSLRYRAGAGPWGIIARRVNRWKNETSLNVPVPAQRGGMAIGQASLSATIVGIEPPRGGSDLEIKPYVLSDVTTNTRLTPPVRRDLGGDFGIDAKYGITQNMTLDVTYRTDFAQVEADEQQINLTRFSLFFPEKREFFLENLGTFSFGRSSGGVGGGIGGSVGGSVGGGGSGAGGGGGGDTPILFYSRRIGLDRGAIVPLQGGGRLTGRVGRFTLGAVNAQSDDVRSIGVKATNFTVLRVKRDVLRRSSIGAILTHRSVDQTGVGENDAFGLDGSFAFLNNNLTLDTYWAGTRTAGLRGNDSSYRARANYETDRYGATLERLVVGANFNPEIGFVRRPDAAESSASLRFSPRPKSSSLVRKYSYSGDFAYIENGRGQLMSRNVGLNYNIQLDNSDQFRASYDTSYEFLPAPFRIADNVTLPSGGYDFYDTQVSYQFGQQRRIFGSVAIQRGTFYNGDKTSISVNAARVALTPKFSVEPSYSLNAVDLVQGSFVTHLAGSRVTYTMTPRMFTSALMQYNSGNHSVSTNARLRWEYRPGSELFVVYNEVRDTLTPSFPDVANRAFIIKVNRLFRF